MDKRIMLVADDSEFNRQVLTELFDADFDIVQASDGIEALNLMRLHARRIAVVLLDIVMPKKDGLDVLREMQLDPMLKGIPVIVASTAGDHAFRIKALDLGAVDYIASPFNPMLAKLRVKSALTTREYERLRLQNEMLQVQRREAANYRALLEDMHTAVLEFDMDGRVKRYDDVIKRELAGTYDGRQLTDIWREDGVATPEAINALKKLINRVISNSDVVNDFADVSLRRRDGARAWYRLRLIKKTAGDTSAPLVMSISDIDAQKREEEATRVQLIRALNEAERANLAKSEFMSRMSHEIRTPLNAMVGFIQMARANIRDLARVDEYLTKAELSSRHLLAILNDVLDISAIESGRITINYESYSIKELVNSVTSIIYAQVHKKNQQFQIILDGVANERVVGDKMRVSQILLNLLSNAVKFTPQNGSVTLTLKQKSLNADRVVMDFIVKDDGIGMSKEFLTRLGVPFEQQNAVTASRYGGSGLGLTITKSLISLMNGALSVESVEGQGSTFTVSLPLDIEKTESAPPLKGAYPDVNALVIDRDEMSASHARACFRNIGCQCDCATSGKEALNLCMQHNYNLVLMDWKLPDLDGESIIAAIRQAVDTEPVFVIMAYDVAEVRARAGKRYEFVTKPIFPSTVLELLMGIYGEYKLGEVEAPRARFNGKRLLLAEDNALNMEIACRILQQLGFFVVPVVNGAEACEAFINSAPGEFDAILLDVQMPIMNGYDATRRIRASAHPSGATIPIFAMTANAFSQDVANALNSGMNGHIAKPIDVDRLCDTLSAILGV